MTDNNKYLTFLKGKVEREKRARSEAERLLEIKSFELYKANQLLIESNQNLDQIVSDRTKALKQAQQVAEKAADNLQESVDHLQLIIQVSGATIWDWNLSNDSFVCSETIEDQLGVTSSDVSTFEAFNQLFHPNDKQAVDEAFNKRLKLGVAIDIECRILHKGGKYRWFHVLGQLARNTEKISERFVGSFLDIHEQVESKKTIEKIAHYDALTSIPNRGSFNKYIHSTIEYSNKFSTQFALLIIDLNDFKNINDCHGHDVGDAVLIKVSSTLKAHIKGYDFVARLGGDEFAVVLNKLSSQSSLDSLFYKIFAVCAEPTSYDENQLSVDLSVGIAYYPKNGKTVERLLHCADVAMYAAKQSKISGSTFSHYQPSLDAERTRKRNLRNKIELAIEEDQFYLEFQPCIEMSTGICHSCEALLRWSEMPDDMTIQDVIDVAEESVMILHLSQLVIDFACRFIARLESLAMTQKIGINLSAIQFQYQDIIEIISAAIQKHKIDPHHFQVEVTENLFLGNMERAVSTLEKLSAIGVEIYIDDFGTGYSSLKYLQQLPVDGVKIDKSFIDGLGVSDSNLTIIKSVIEMTHGMGRRVVAEGVETTMQYQLLSEMGCDVTQGYLISRPLSENDCIDWLNNHAQTKK